MKPANAAAFCVLLVASMAMADTFYRYHDPATGRDVFVNRLEQVPRKVRGQATVVFESAPTDEAKQVAPPPPSNEGLPEKLMKDLAPAASPAGTARGAGDTGAWKLGTTRVAAAVDARLLRAGGAPLAEAERTQLGRLLAQALALVAVAMLCAFCIWVALIVAAFRDKQPGWAVGMLVLWPVATLYLLLYFGKGRPLLKAASTLGLLAPALVGVWIAWQLYAWLQLVGRARGVSI